MADGASPKPPGRVRGRPFERGRSGNPAGRRTGSLNKTTAAAAALLARARLSSSRWSAIRPQCGSASSGFCRLAATHGQFRAAADRERRRHRRGNEGGHLGIGRWRDHARRSRDHRGGGRHLCPGDRDERFRPAATAHGGRFRQPGAGRSERRAGDALQLLGEVLLQICCRCSNTQSATQVLVAGQRSASRQARAAASRIAPVSMW